MATPFYEQDGIQIYCGDCREILPQLGPVSVVLTDPPYSEHVHANSRTGAAIDVSVAADFGFASLDPTLRLFVAQEAARLAERWVLAFCDLESAHLWRADILAAGLEHIRSGVWIKPGCAPQFTGDRPSAGFDVIEIAHRPGKKRWNGGGSSAVWSVPVMRGGNGTAPRHHPTEKPLALMSKLMSLFSESGETILDPFAGSGTTGRACKDLGRRCIMIERESRYCEIAVERLRQRVLL